MPPSPTDQVYAPTGWPSVEDLSIDDPHCTNDTCKAFREGFADDERSTPLLRLLEYGKWTVWFYSFWILLFTAIYVYNQDRAIAFIRFYTYRRPNNRFTTKIGLRQISYGTLALLVFSTLFFAVLPWPQQRYLRARFRFGSPPLSVRCAMVISALTPLTVALAGKVNVITWMTGVGYEKLNVYHRYVAYVIFCLATIHTVPHLIAPVRDGGWRMLDTLYANKKRELSGTPLYLATFGLAVFSIPWIRRRFYEAFKYVHIFLAVAYIGLLWWHIWGEYMSPYYMYATIAVLLFSNILRILHRHRNLRSFSNLSGFPTTLTHLHGNTTRVAIQVPKSLKWKAGQHAFIRMPSISCLGNHPFSIANVPSSEKEGSTHEMVFLIRRQRGFTKKLFECEQGLAGDTDSQTPPCSFEFEKRKAIDVGEGKVIQIKKEKGLQKEKHTELTEHIENINLVSAVDAITVLEEEVASPMSPLPRTPFPLTIIPPLKRQPSISSFPPRDEITEAKLQAISQKPADAPSSFRTSAFSKRRSSVSSLRTIVDGPYGSHHRPLHQIYDSIVCIAGGSGITASLPRILYLTQRLRNQQKDEILATKRIHLVWIIRDAEWVSWIEREINTAIRNIREHPSPNACSFTIDIFITRSAALAESASPSEDELSPMSPIPPVETCASDRVFDSLGGSEKGVYALPSRPRPVLRRLNGGRGLFDEESNFGIEKGEGSASRGVSVAMHYCRPVVRDVVEGYVGGDRAIIMGCGPPSLSAELANTAADLQRRVWNGEMKELKLDIETFGW